MKLRRQRDLFPGALEMMILRTLKRQPLHGYALVQHIKRTSNDLLQIEEGSLYPALQRLLKEELVKAEWCISSTNRRVRTYRLTAAGAKHLVREVSNFERMLEGKKKGLPRQQPLRDRRKKERQEASLHGIRLSSLSWPRSHCLLQFRQRVYGPLHFYTLPPKPSAR